MKILLIVTGHRHNVEYKYFGKFLEHCKYLSSKNCDIFIHSNCDTNDISENIKYIKNTPTVHITNKNIGYTLGGIEAVSDILDMLNLIDENCKYDYVIHLHPDVFITNEKKIMEILNNEFYTNNIFIVNYSTPNINAYSFDFFIFKPKLLKINIFNNYKTWKHSPEEFLKKKLLLHEIQHVIINRFDNNFYSPRRIDLNFMWHEHNLNKVKKFIENNNV